MDETLKLIIPALVVVGGWFVAHRFNVSRDRQNKRHDLRVQYLLDAYRRLESAANRDSMGTEDKRSFESAIADIQLLGDNLQIDELMKFLTEYKREGNSALIDPLLEVMRESLRKELQIEACARKVVVFRFRKNK